MKRHYTTKQKYMDSAPDWEIDGGATGRAVSDGRYMPEMDTARRREDEPVDDGINRPLLWAVILGCVVIDFLIVLYFLLK